MVLSVLFIFTGALLAPLIVRMLKQRAGAVLSLLPAFFFAQYLVSWYPEISSGEVISTTVQWIPALDIHLSFYLDGLSFLFALLVLGIGALVLIYANGYMRGHHHHGRFYGYLLLFMGSMLGLVLAGNLMSLFVFWELTSVSSYLLIGFYNKQHESRKAALQAMIITEIGGLALLSGFILMGMAGGGFGLQELLNNPEIIRNSSFFPAIIVLVLLGALTKSAQFPFHFWLPGAMKAPTPVSAYLHSATMVKAGIYLLARLTPVLGENNLWHHTLVLVGGTTMFLGAYKALTSKDLKTILAYTTINSLGVMVMLIGTGTSTALKAMLLYVIVHALYKASLFMVAGTLGEKTGTRNIYLLGNLKKEMPVLTIFSVLVLLSMAGLPPLLGYVSKELIYEAQLETAWLSHFILVVTVLSNMLMLVISILIGYQVFFTRERNIPQKPEQAGWASLTGPAIMGVLSIGLAVFPNQLEPELESAVLAVSDKFTKIDIKLWHGFNEVFWVSLLTVALGLLFFAVRKKVLPAVERFNNRYLDFNLADLTYKLAENIYRLTTKNTRYLQHGYLRFYLVAIFVISSILMWYEIIKVWKWDFFTGLEPIYWFATAIAVIMMLSSFAAIRTRSKLTAIVTMGVVGFGLAIIFMMYGAVDLTITQILVETLTLGLFVLVVFRLPQFSSFSTRNTRIRDAIIAAVSGSFMAAIVLIALSIEVENPVSDFFVKNSYSEAHGKNIVNVILVDFRALDTAGEVTVLSIAALGIVALLKLRRNNNPEK